ncbi:MAG: S8 family serine peptidase [Candidatus Kapabacteria bacterium]|nr:S8 family serine peptidase [Candidatus Kapabacteria bacterium]
MKSTYVAVVTFLAIASIIANANESFIVRMRSATIPSALLRYSPRTILPSAYSPKKLSDRVQSREQRDAYESLRRYVVVTLPADGSILDLEKMDDLIDIRPLLTMHIHDEPITNDSLSNEQYALPIIGAERAWKLATGKGVIVGILDTGIDWTHEDLVGSMAVTVEEDLNKNGRFDDWSSNVDVNGVTGDLNGADDDGNGVVDDVIGYDFVDQDVRNLGDDRTRDPIPFDEQGHGTSVGGVIAATPNNRVGIAGLAYGARLRALRAFDATGNAEEDDIASALVYAALTGVNVVNMSFGDGVDSPMLRDAVRFALSMNVVLVASVGNSGTTSRQYPAGYDGVIAVGSTNDEDKRSPFSSTGSLVSLTAPGEGIVTTAVNSRYRRVNGTSFSAPYVVAAAAMMLEHFPDISPSEIRGTLQERSRDLGEQGWDGLFGAGRLQVDASLNAQGLSIFEITSPGNEDEYDAMKAQQLAVVGSVLVAPFSSYTIDVGVGIDPSRWVTVASSSTSVRNDTLARIDLAALASGLNTVRLHVLCKDGRALDDRKRITVVKNDSLRFLSIESLNAWRTDRRTPSLAVRTSRPTTMTVSIIPEGAQPSLQVTDVKRFVRSHNLLLSDTIRANSKYVLSVSCTADDGDHIDTVITLDASREGAPTVSGWKQTQSASWSGYVLNDVRDMYGDGKPTVVMNDLSSGSFGRIVTMQYDKGEWWRRDSLNSTWIPRGICDANGNGLLEILAHVVGRAVLFEQTVVGGSPFARIIFSDSSGKQNGAGVADIDGDGREELLLLSDSGCTAVTYRNGRFERLGTAVNTSNPTYGSSTNRVDEISVGAGDFDGDGKMEVAFGDTDGDLIISEWDGGLFTNRFILESSGGGGSGYVAAGDVDADGKPDVVFGVPDSTQPDANREYGRDLWTYRLIRSDANDSYRVAWQDYVAGVRYGIGYRNGIDVGDLDLRPGKEIVVCAYPRLFVFGYNTAEQRVVSKWFVPDVVSPRFLTYDFNKNGINELGYGITVPELGVMTGFRFSELDTASRLSAPTSLRGRYANQDTITLDWMPVPLALRYEIYASTNNGPYRILGTEPSRVYSTPAPSGVSSVRYAVVALPIDTMTVKSQRSNDASFSFGPLITAVGLDRDTVTRSELRRGLRINVRYSGEIMVDHVEPKKFTLSSQSDGSELASSTSTLAGKQTDVVLSFPGIHQEENLGLRVRSIIDEVNRQIPEKYFPLTVIDDTPASVDFAIASLSILAPNVLRLSFTSAVDATALERRRYTLDPIGSVLAVSRVDTKTVDLQLDPASPLTARGVTYALTTRGVQGDPSGSITTGAGNTATFIVVASDLRDVYVYPHPVHLQKVESITFGGLTSVATIDVLDNSMRTLVSLSNTDGNGGIRWDLRTSVGERVPPGLYFYRVSGTTEDGVTVEPVLKKLLIER